MFPRSVIFFVSSEHCSHCKQGLRECICPCLAKHSYRSKWCWLVSNTKRGICLPGHIETGQGGRNQRNWITKVVIHCSRKPKRKSCACTVC